VHIGLAALDYQKLLWLSYRADPHRAGLGPPGGAQIEGVMLLTAFAASCLAVALAARRLGRRFHATAPGSEWPVLLTFSLAAAIVPTLLVATVLWPDGRGALSSGVLLGVNIGLAVALAATSHLTRRAAPADGPTSARRVVADSLDAWSWTLIAIAAVLSLAVFMNGYTAIRGYDSMGYHLPLAASWLKHSRLVTGPEEALNLFYPGNFELLVRWLLAPGVAHYAFLASFFSAVACVSVVFLIARHLGQPRRVALVSAVCAATFPAVAYLSATGYSDIFAALALLLAILFLLRWKDGGSTNGTLMLCIGLSLGIAIGTKYSAVAPALVIAAICLADLFRSFRFVDEFRLQRVDTRRLAHQLLILGGSVAACSAFWYVRNLVEHGNPVFPVEALGLRGVSMRYLIPVDPALSNVRNWFLYPWGSFAYREDDLGAMFAAIVLPAFLLTPVMRRRGSRSRKLLWWISLAGLVLWLRTGNITPRYGLFPLLLCCVFAGELWMEFESAVLKTVTVASLAGMTALMGTTLISEAVYNRVVRPARNGVPVAVDSLPPARILNGLGGQSAYHAMGADHRHQVITLYRDVAPGDVLRYRPDYLLLSASQVPVFRAHLVLALVERSPQLGGPETTLWRVQYRRP
ncbi:MAG: glycosyltransferase family 39 protein, partial [Gemmatimonadota bacterium]|nr:glycosyltransferase family 39 protein [Gemmatimonadota bacterium]